MDLVESVPVEKRAEILPGVNPVIQARWSPRSFSDRTVSNEDLKTVLEAARWAASSNNEQPWRFIVARKSDTGLYEKLLNVLDPSNQTWARTAPVLMITAAKRTFSKSGKPNLHFWHDTGAALAHLSLQATALGLHTHGMAGFDHERAEKELGIPDDYQSVAAVALGYLADPDALPEPYRTREKTPRERKPLSEIVFNGSWDKPLAL